MEELQKAEKEPRVAAIAAHAEQTLQAVARAKIEGLIIAILIGGEETKFIPEFPYGMIC